MPVTSDKSSWIMDLHGGSRPVTVICKKSMCRKMKIDRPIYSEINWVKVQDIA